MHYNISIKSNFLLFLVLIGRKSSKKFLLGVKISLNYLSGFLFYIPIITKNPSKNLYLSPYLQEDPDWAIF